MSEKTESTARTEAEIIEELERTRAEMTATVDELFARVQPDHLIAQAKDTAKTKVEEIKTYITTTVADARDGNPDALKKVGYAIAGVGAVAAIILMRVLRSKR